MIFEKNVKIDFNIEDFISQLDTYDYSKENIESELDNYFDNLVGEDITYTLLDSNDREKILMEVIDKTKNIKLSIDQMENIEIDIQKYNNRIEVYQKKIQELKKILKENNK